MNLKVLGACLAALLTFAVTPAHSQDEGQRASTGGAQTLEDICLLYTSPSPRD